MVHNIVIIGGNFSGVSEAHFLLGHVFPKLHPQRDPSKPLFKVTLISPNSHTYFKVGAPRALVSEDVIHDNSAFASIPEGFSKYNTAEFTFVQGNAVSLDEKTKTITVEPTSDDVNSKPSTATTTSVKYDSLVISTGTTSTSPLWTLHGPHTITALELAKYYRQISTAKSILIAGGGPAGIETAGEIAYKYHTPELTLLSGGPRLLQRLKTVSMASGAESRLSAIGVTTIHNVRVTASKEDPATGKTTLTLSNGTTKSVDLYIDATGGKPNTSFLPQAWLQSSDSRVVTDKTSLRATQAPKDVYAIGDVASFSNQNVFDATFPIAPLGYTIWEDLASSPTGKAASLQGPPKPKPYKQMEADMQLVPVGPQGGVGVVFGWRVFSFMVWWIKCRTFFLEKAPLLATGEEYAK